MAVIMMMMDAGGGTLCRCETAQKPDCSRCCGECDISCRYSSRGSIPDMFQPATADLDILAPLNLYFLANQVIGTEGRGLREAVGSATLAQNRTDIPPFRHKCSLRPHSQCYIYREDIFEAFSMPTAQRTRIWLIQVLPMRIARVYTVDTVLYHKHERSNSWSSQAV